MATNELQKSEVNFSFTIDQFSKLNETVLSPPCYIHDLPFKIMIMPRVDPFQEDKKSLGFFLQCNAGSKSTTWSCHASAEFHLKSFKRGQEPFIRKIQHVFCPKADDYGFSFFMPWSMVIDKNNGFIQNDTIEVEVHVIADPPKGELK